MSITLTGLSHRTSPIAIRERLAFSAESLPAGLRRLKRRFASGGVVILNTCNRVEIYVRAEEEAAGMHAAVRDFLEEVSGVSECEFADCLYEYDNRDAVAHLFRVAASLDSLVVGEDQILGQVHDAYLLAHKENVTEKVISGLFQRAFKVAKDVRTRTNIGVGRVSISSVAVDLAVSIFMTLTDKTVLVIGSGETGELTLKSLVGRGVGQVIVANRTLEKALPIAEAFQGEAISLANLPAHLHRADIVISSTSATEPVLGLDDFQRALKQRNLAPMFVIDIAVPRDIAPVVNTLDNVYLYDIDDLQQVADQNLQARRAEISRCLEIIDDHVERFLQWRQSLYAHPTIISMSHELHAIRERELEKTFATLPDLTEKQRAEVEYLSKRIVNNILQRPLTELKEVAVREESHRMLHLVRRLFGLEEQT
jgi:glutamyl-tRNA reductase